MKKLGILIIIVLSIFMIGCSKNLKKYAGEYEGMYTRYVGDPEDVTNKETFSLILNDNGKGVHKRDGYEYEVTWNVKKDKLNIKEKFMGLTNEYTGIFEDGKLVLYNGELTEPFTLQLIYKKK